MSEAKIDFSFNDLHFLCEGDKDWVEAQLNQILNRIPEFNIHKAATAFNNTTAENSPVYTDQAVEAISPELEAETKSRTYKKAEQVAASTQSEEINNPLALFLKDKNAERNQVKKFLAIAVFLYSRGEEKLSTPMVSKTLKALRMEKLMNASDCLNKNEKKGYCIKNGKEFVLTQDGIQSILGVVE